MAYILRFVQKYRPADREAFLELERCFAAAEAAGELPRGERRQPRTGRLPGNTLIWEGRFATLAELEAARTRMDESPKHTELFRQQAPFMLDAWTEIDETIDF